MIPTSSLAIRTGITARWFAFLGYALALSSAQRGHIEWILLVFPVWLLLISIYILIENLRRPSQIAAISSGLDESL